MSPEQKYSICANVHHDGHPAALEIYRAHRSKPRHFNAEGWLLYFTDKEVARLEVLVGDITRSEGITLPMVDVDALSTREISIYSFGDANLIDLMRRSRRVTINMTDPAL